MVLSPTPNAGTLGGIRGDWLRDQEPARMITANVGAVVSVPGASV